jgi:hypothetical protein
MKRIRLLLAGLAVVLSLLPSTVLAAGPYTESVFGIQTGFSPSAAACQGAELSSFAGTAHGTLNGVFQIDVCHTQLDTTARITGGTYTLTNQETTLTGSFVPGGSVLLLAQNNYGALCIQRYAVSGGLTPGGGFSGILTHVGFVANGSCNVFFAFITGTTLIAGP